MKSVCPISNQVIVTTQVYYLYLTFSIEYLYIETIAIYMYMKSLLEEFLHNNCKCC